MNDINGPELRVQISPLLALEDSDDIATAIFRLKNYPGESIDISKLRETVKTKNNSAQFLLRTQCGTPRVPSTVDLARA